MVALLALGKEPTWMSCNQEHAVVFCKHDMMRYCSCPLPTRCPSMSAGSADFLFTLPVQMPVLRSEICCAVF
jgi:hypothetical protein